MEGPALGTLLVIGIVAVVILVLREVTLWYFRINQRFDQQKRVIELLEEQNQLMQQQNQVLIDIATMQHGSMPTNNLQTIPLVGDSTVPVS